MDAAFRVVQREMHDVRAARRARTEALHRKSGEFRVDWRGMPHALHPKLSWADTAYRHITCAKENMYGDKTHDSCGRHRNGGSTVNRGHAHHRSIMCRSAREGRPRCFGGTQRDGGTCNDKVRASSSNGSRSLPPWPALSCVHGTTMRSSTLCPPQTSPRAGSGAACRARHRRASGARRSRNVAFSRSMYAVLITPPLRPTQEGLHACRRAIDNAAFGRDHMPPLVVFDDLGDQDMAPRTKPWPSAHAHVHGSRTSPAWRGCRIPSHPYRSRGAAMPHSA